MARKLCTTCNIRAIGTGGGDDADSARGLDMCNPCYTEGAWENSHGDYGHDAINEMSVAERMSPAGQERIRETDGCWICYPELNLAQKPHTPRATKGHNSPRRKQLNHKGHSHRQSPAERRACKELFWATPGADAMTWDAHIDRDSGKMVAGGRKAKK